MSLAFGDLAQSYALRSQISRAKSETFRLANELASGQKTDVAASLGGDTTALFAIERTRAMSEGYRTAARDEALLAETRQSALGSVHDQIDSIRAAVMATLQGGSDNAPGRTAAQARTAFGQAVQTLNTEVGGRNLFAGMANNRPPLAAPETILAALSTEIAGLTLPEDISARISAWFNDPAGFEAVAYLGAPPHPGTIISADGTRVADRTALDKGVRDGLAGLATAAFLDTPALSPAGADRAAFARLAQGALATGGDAVTNLRAAVGVDQAQIEQTRVGLEAEGLTLGIARSEILSADAAQTATELEAMRSNLETIFAVAARLSRLNLSEFLR